MCLYRVRSSCFTFLLHSHGKTKRIQIWKREKERERKKVLSYLLCMRTSRAVEYILGAYIFIFEIITHGTDFFSPIYLYFFHSGFSSAHYIRFIYFFYHTKEIIARHFILRMCRSWKKKLRPVFFSFAFLRCVCYRGSVKIYHFRIFSNRNWRKKNSFSSFFSIIIICVVFVFFCFVFSTCISRGFCALLIKMSTMRSEIKNDEKWN